MILLRSHPERSEGSAVRLFPLLLLLLSACLRFGGTLPPRELYRLGGLADSTARPAIRLPLPLSIAPYETPGIFANANIAYRIDDGEYGTYPSREWALPLSVMLGTLTQDRLAFLGARATDVVYAPPSRTGFPYEWRGRVRRFEEVDRGTVVSIAVELEARIIRTADDSVLWRGNFAAERPVVNPTMPGIVAALSALAQEGILALGQDASRALPLRVPPAQ
ncbi:MAG: hypothetical protein JWO05_2375 [Gemmatimonadetes bacterium]|nr:hypothetical protein [Gemmatimonadota bacterium]